MYNKQLKKINMKHTKKLVGIEFIHKGKIVAIQIKSEKDIVDGYMVLRLTYDDFILDENPNKMNDMYEFLDNFDVDAKHKDEDFQKYCEYVYILFRINPLEQIDPNNGIIMHVVIDDNEFYYDKIQLIDDVSLALFCYDYCKKRKYAK